MAAKKSKTTASLPPAVSYIRMSTDEQEASPGQQRAEVAKLAEKHGYQIVREYLDEGISGASTRKRKSFLQMMDDAERKGDFKAILCWDQDRFGRFDSIEAGRWVHPLRERGIQLITVAQGAIDWASFAGRMIYSIQQEGKNQFLVDLSRNILRGKIATAKKGLINGMAPWGYDREFYDSGKLMHKAKWGDGFRKPPGWETRIVPTDDEATIETIRWIFHAYCTTDMGTRAIQAELTRRGLRSPMGVRWSHTQITNILNTRAYVGDNSFGAVKKGKFHQCGPDGEVIPKNGHATTAPAIAVEKAHKAIIDRETFDRAQAKMEKRKIGKRRSRDSGYILTGILRCGQCGAPMGGRTCRKHGREYRYYICGVAANYDDCAPRLVPAEKIERIVMGVIEDRVLDEANSGRLREKIVEAVKNLTKGAKRAGKSSEREIEALTAKIERVRENMLTADADDVPAAQLILRKLKDQLKAAKESRETADSPNGLNPDLLVKQAMREAAMLRKRLGSGDTMTIRAAMQGVFESVTLFWDGDGRRRKLSRAVFSFNIKESRTKHH